MSDAGQEMITLLQYPISYFIFPFCDIGHVNFVGLPQSFILNYDWQHREKYDPALNECVRANKQNVHTGS